MTSLSITPFLVIIQGPGAPARYPVRDGAQIGRDLSSDIRIEDDQSSRQHMHIQARPDGYWAIDQNSTNGTYVNNLRINQPVLLRHGDVIRIGETQLRFELEDLDRTAPHDPPPMPTQVQKPAFSVQPQAAPIPQPQAVSTDPIPPPAPIPVSPAVEPPKRKRRRWVCCLLIPVVFACVIAVLGGGGYYLYTNGTLNQRSVLNLVGQGPGEISLINISDGDVYFAAVRLDTEDGEPTVTNDDTLEPFVIGGFGGLSPGQYRLEIDPQSGVPAGGDCQLEIKSGDKLQFVVVPEGISVIRDGYDPLTADEMILETSPLCQGLR